MGQGMGRYSTVAAALVTFVFVGAGFLCLYLLGLFEDGAGRDDLPYGLLTAIGILGAVVWGVASRYFGRR